MSRCAAIRSVPKDCLPNSLQTLVISVCKAMRYLPKDGLPSSLEELEIRNCPAMQLLPKVDSLPNSLRVLDVQDSESEVLRRQCRKWIGIIPIDHREDANYLNTPIEHYHEMATIFGNSLATGAYAKGANDPLVSEVTEMDIAPKITSSEPTELHDVDGGTQPFNNGAEYTGTKQPPSKKQRLATEDELIVMISKSLGELSASINKLAEPKLAVPKGLYEELKSIPGFDEAYLEHYYAYLCDNPPLARAFYALPLVSSKMIWVARYIKDHMPELM
ncbi:hypothetical protein U9M48_040462 [Paspalum notatum var. saurae]|uniref:Uncharacterized protein n=1 Tax=Paspalum notatum var. saurae TaxID=547442 RepID=A0AAQ3USD4_PASNO